MQKPSIKQKVWIRIEAAEKMLKEANLRYPLETGGILIGYFMETDVVIVDVIGPGKSAKHEIGIFTPDYYWHDQEVARLYKRSGRRHTYLGDWHTHPDGFGSLSIRDIATLHNIARCKSARVSNPVMAILSGKRKWKIALWNYAAMEKGRAVIEEIGEVNLYSS